MADAILSRRELGFYVYVHRRATDDSIFYVGKGIGRRAWKIADRNPHWQAIANKHGFAVSILHSGLTEEQALELERTTILGLKSDGVILSNRTDGGDRGGTNPCEETRNLMRAAKLGKKRGPQSVLHRQKIAESQIGKDVSKETRHRISEATKAAMRSPEIVEKMRTAKLGKKRQPHSEETKAKMRAASLGRPKSEAARQAMSVAQRKRFAKEAQPS